MNPGPGVVRLLLQGAQALGRRALDALDHNRYLVDHTVTACYRPEEDEEPAG